jgi:mRNA-degrading endonuclease RelE of RelBE toxin-antitoxin system
MDRIDKFIFKLNKNDRKFVVETMRVIRSNNVSHLNIKKLKGFDDLFRARVGQYRIIYTNIDGVIEFLKVSNRDDNTYKF